MKLKFRSSLSNFNKFNPFDSQTSDAKPIDLSLKSRIKNFMKKTNNEFKTSSDSINSIGSTNSSSNSLKNHHFNYSNVAPINNLINQSIINQINIPPSPPNSVEEDEEDCFQQQQFYYNQLMNKNNYENHLQSTDLLNTSHLNQINKYSIENTANLLSIYTSQKINEQFLECNSDRFTNMPPSPVQLVNDKSEQNQQHIHYQKQMVRKHISQSTKQQRTQNHYNPYSQILKRKYAKQNLDDENEDELEDLDYYDSNKLINKLRMKYCTTNKVRQQSNNHSISNDQSNYENKKNKLPIHNQISSSNDSNNLINNQQNKLKTTNIEQLNSNLYNTNSLEMLYKEYYNYFLSQPDSNIKLSALQILMKNAFNQQNDKLNSIAINQLSSSIDTHSLSSTPSPNSHINYNNDDIYSPRTPSSPKYELLNDIPVNLNPQEERKRSSRPLTGRHVRQGTGASPTTLANLKLAIKERQKSSSFKPIKRNKK